MLPSEHYGTEPATHCPVPSVYFLATRVAMCSENFNVLYTIFMQLTKAVNIADDIQCGSKNRTPVIFSNNFNKYLSIFIIFGADNKQCVSNVHVCNLRVLMKQDRLIQLASDSSCVRRFFTHLRCNFTPVILNYMDN